MPQHVASRPFHPSRELNAVPEEKELSKRARQGRQHFPSNKNRPASQPAKRLSEIDAQQPAESYRCAPFPFVFIFASLASGILRGGLRGPRLQHRRQRRLSSVRLRPFGVHSGERNGACLSGIYGWARGIDKRAPLGNDSPLGSGAELPRNKCLECVAGLGLPRLLPEESYANLAHRTMFRQTPWNEPQREPCPSAIPPHINASFDSSVLTSPGERTHSTTAPAASP